MALSERSVIHNMTEAMTILTNAINASTSQSDIVFDATTARPSRHAGATIESGTRPTDRSRS
jgi:hypothetical protein